MLDARTLTTTLQALLPEAFAVAASTHCPREAALAGDERAATAGMVPKRLTEFTHGRHCARLALRQLGSAAAPIAKGPNREPVWPPGIVGSITHTGGWAAAAVGYSKLFSGVGIDIERDGPLDEATRKLILRPNEQLTIASEDSRLVFSIKEAIYKCIFPTAGRYVDFAEIEVALDAGRGRFTARTHWASPLPELPAELRGHFARAEEHVLASAWLAALPE